MMLRILPQNRRQNRRYLKRGGFDALGSQPTGAREQVLAQKQRRKITLPMEGIGTLCTRAARLKGCLDPACSHSLHTRIQGVTVRAG